MIRLNEKPIHAETGLKEGFILQVDLQEPIYHKRRWCFLQAGSLLNGVNSAGWGELLLWYQARGKASVLITPSGWKDKWEDFLSLVPLHLDQQKLMKIPFWVGGLFGRDNRLRVMDQDNGQREVRGWVVKLGRGKLQSPKLTTPLSWHSHLLSPNPSTPQHPMGSNINQQPMRSGNQQGQHMSSLPTPTA